MKSIIAAMLTCAVLFGASYAGSLYFMQNQEPDEEVVTPLEESVDQASTLPPENEKIGNVAVMPVANRPERGISLEAVLRMSDSIKKMEEKLILREKRVSKEEQRVKLLFVDLETEQDRLKAFSNGIDAKVEVLTKTTADLKTTLEALDARKAEIMALEKKTGVDDESVRNDMEKKVNDVKGWFANLEAEQAATYLKEFANNGKLDFAASLLHKMPDRQKSKILGALSDPALVNQLIDALRVAPKTPK